MATATVVDDCRHRELAARKLLELSNAFEPVQDGRIHIEKINRPFLYRLRGTPAEYKGRVGARHRQRLAVWLHESGKRTEAGAAMFA